MNVNNNKKGGKMPCPLDTFLPSILMLWGVGGSLIIVTIFSGNLYAIFAGISIATLLAVIVIDRLEYPQKKTPKKKKPTRRRKRSWWW